MKFKVGDTVGLKDKYMQRYKGTGIGHEIEKVSEKYSLKPKSHEFTVKRIFRDNYTDSTMYLIQNDEHQSKMKVNEDDIYIHCG